MRLNTIKLSGFKSFVDPTSLTLPSNLIGVVGPNGCGKSNVIDAVRWVMGESSARVLRGEAMTDVIFAGSTTRKPVSSAVVELIFDNSDGTLGGEYSAFSEISVKRSVSRDGQSGYFLNGARCRRRDITDLFLGTGLGSRSYSIIEQGMISQIVEAHPEDLRGHLEEAAGISKYKERRRETETRIRHTRENLERLNDVREEVDKQLKHLERQAKQAERYTELKAEQRKLGAEFATRRLELLNQEAADKRAQQSLLEVTLAEAGAQERSAEAAIEQLREQQSDSQRSLSQAQAESFRVLGEISRAEQQRKYLSELKVRRASDLNELESALERLAREMDTDASRRRELDDILQGMSPALEDLEAQRAEISARVREREGSLGSALKGIQEQAQRLSVTTQAAEVERTRIEYLDRQAALKGQRRNTLEEELKAIQFDQLERDLSADQEQVERLNTQAEAIQASLDRLKSELTGSETTLSNLTREREERLNAISLKRGRLSSLEALQQSALGRDGGVWDQFVERCGLKHARRLAEVIEVDNGFEDALEAVLGELLKAPLAGSPLGFASALADAKSGDLAVLSDQAQTARGAAGTLLGCVRGPQVLNQFLVRIHCAPDLAAARAKLLLLNADESVITPEGVWLGHGFVRVSRGDAGRTGLLKREREIEALRHELDSLDEGLEALSDQIARVRAERDQRNSERERQGVELNLVLRRRGEQEAQLQARRTRLEIARTRAQKLEEEHALLMPEIRTDLAQAREARARVEALMNEMVTLDEERLGLAERRREQELARESERQHERDLEQKTRSLAVEIESKRAQRQALETAVNRLIQQETQISERRAALIREQHDADTPNLALEANLNALLDSRIGVDAALVAARSAVEAIDQALRQQEQERQRAEQRQRALIDSRQTLALALNSMELKGAALDAEIIALGFEFAALKATLEGALDLVGLEQQLTEIEHKIRRLEPVNLAAISEFAEQGERKRYLDAQNDDLVSALTTLEDAIRKIDRETRTRFKETFDRVNAGLQTLFPRLFGGGHAYLEMTGDDLLSTGVSILARPPGKRVSSIQLLSGGEKALTAVALVFAIFQLNPAPFCLLDEVDAPLDEANVGRFSAMVLEMSEKVQFLFVTHNKVTMEAAHQLVGVTMREPGVSRLVSVDINEAEKLIA